jgi:hypothetical protein
LDKTARQVLEIEWPDHLIMIRSIDDTDTLRNWVSAFPILVAHNGGANIVVEFSTDFLECVANPELFAASSRVFPDVRQRILDLRMPLSIGELNIALKPES